MLGRDASSPAAFSRTGWTATIALDREWDYIGQLLHLDTAPLMVGYAVIVPTDSHEPVVADTGGVRHWTGPPIGIQKGL